MSAEIKPNEMKLVDDTFNPIGPVPTGPGEVIDADEKRVVHDSVFGDITEDGPNYRNVGWVRSVALMMKTQIGLGVLSMPAVLDTLGIVPGVILICVIGGITTWSDYMVGVFKLRHPAVYGVDDVGQLIFGRTGREMMSVAFCLFFTFVAGSAMLSVSIALNAVSMHATCSAAFVAIAAIVGFAFASIQTLGKIGWIAWVGVSSIIIAVFTVTIAVGLQDRPAAAPQAGPWQSDYKLFGKPSFTQAISACSSIIFSYAGTPAFFNIAAEMRNPRQYTRGLIICQSVISVTYIVVGVVVYYYCGSYVASPAPGSAGPLLKKVAYGIGLPGLLVSTLLSIHLPSKFIFVRMLRGSRHLTANTATHWISWIASTAGVTLVAYVIASGIPVFGSLVSLIGALLGTLLCFQPMGCMWLYDNWKTEKRTVGWSLMVTWSAFVIVSGTFLMVAGTYGSIKGIMASSSSGAWSCADNSGSA